MKPASIINRGESFVTLRATTDTPGEIQEALAARDVQHLFKGDQNQAWDAVLANHCLARAVGDEDAEITFFIQDERLGTSDARLARQWRQQGREYTLTEDYFRGRAGAVWEHQDTSYGLFFTEAVAPEQFERAGIHLHRAAELWERHAAGALADREWLRALEALGVSLTAESADSATRLGAAADTAALGTLFAEVPLAALYYAFTKTDGLYGVVPIENRNVTMSSIPAGHAELREAWRRLLVGVAGRGAMRLAGSAAQRRRVRERVRRLAGWAERFIEERPEASVADFQEALGLWLTNEIFPADWLALDRTSRFTHLEERDLHRLRRPQETLHYFLDLALRHPQGFTEAYNEALNRVGYGLQRVKWSSETGHYTPPFFVEFAPDGPGTPVYRYGLELTGLGPTVVTLTNPAAGTVVIESAAPVRSAAGLVELLLRELPSTEGLAIMGKAATFAAELQRTPRGLGLPRQGSKYAPMVDHFVSGLRERGLLDQPTGLLIRIGLNMLDRLRAMGDLPLRVPRFLQSELGRSTTCRDLSRRWREIAGDAHAQLDLLQRCEFGQQVHLAKAICLNASGGDWQAARTADPRLDRLARRLENGPDGAALLRRLGRDTASEAVAVMQRLLGRRERLLAERRADASRSEGAPGRRVPADSGRRRELEAEREQVECQLLLLVAACVRRLWQRAESLTYLNDRPYTLALYLLFGADVFPPICRNVEFDVEYLSPCLAPCAPDHATAGACR
jgi:hypothetical protein